MNEIKSFTFYKNYYELIDNLPQEDKRLMLEVIVDYIFRDVEPIGLEKMNLAIWNNIKMPLDTSKKQALNGLRGGRPTNEEKTQTETQIESQTKAKAKANNISNFLFLFSNFNFINNNINLKNKIEEWLKYKWERKEYYKETGFKTLLARIDSATSQYGVEEVLNLIDECMANNYKGIIFEKLNGKKIKSNQSQNEKIKQERDKWENE